MAGKCDKCLNNLEIGIYQYIDNSYCITDLNNTIIRELFYDKDITGIDLTSKFNIKYCTGCNNFFNYPIEYKEINKNTEVLKPEPPVCSICQTINDINTINCVNCNGEMVEPSENKIQDNIIYKFVINDLNDIIEYYQNFLNDNIIHNFNNIQCRKCKNSMRKGYFKIIDNEDISIENFNRVIQLCNDETGDIIKELDDNNISINFKLKDLTTEISKKIIYCDSCYYSIMNNLKEIEVELEENVETVSWEFEETLYPLVCSNCFKINDVGITVCEDCGDNDLQ